MNDENTCPKCGSPDIAGLMQSFWVGLDENGDMKGQWIDYQSESEVGEQRLCRTCDHEWIYGAE